MIEKLRDVELLLKVMTDNLEQIEKLYMEYYKLPRHIRGGECFLVIYLFTQLNFPCTEEQISDLIELAKERSKQFPSKFTRFLFYILLRVHIKALDIHSMALNLKIVRLVDFPRGMRNRTNAELVPLIIAALNESSVLPEEGNPAVLTGRTDDMPNAAAYLPTGNQNVPEDAITNVTQYKLYQKIMFSNNAPAIIELVRQLVMGKKGVELAKIALGMELSVNICGNVGFAALRELGATGTKQAFSNAYYRTSKQDENVLIYKNMIDNI